MVQCALRNPKSDSRAGAATGTYKTMPPRLPSRTCCEKPCHAWSMRLGDTLCEPEGAQDAPRIQSEEVQHTPQMQSSGAPCAPRIQPESTARNATMQILRPSPLAEDNQLMSGGTINSFFGVLVERYGLRVHGGRLSGHWLRLPWCIPPLPVFYDCFDFFPCYFHRLPLRYDKLLHGRPTKAHSRFRKFQFPQSVGILFS